ncbi:unnamed protein product [Ectocarpus sp. CCAP 1310/34]|nr:unnamed protein product [Ectocarpus sp. CCAP 1310/34]
MESRCRVPSAPPRAQTASLAHAHEPPSRRGRTHSLSLSPPPNLGVMHPLCSRPPRPPRHLREVRVCSCSSGRVSPVPWTSNSQDRVAAVHPSAALPAAPP